MADLIPLDVAKRHLRITDTAHDTDVQDKANQAAAIIFDYLKKPDPTWTTFDVIPGPVQAAMLELLTGLYEHRGDDFGVNGPDDELWKAIERKVIRFRDPALA